MNLATNFEVSIRAIRRFEKASDEKVAVYKDSLVDNNPIELHKSMFRANQHVLPPSCRRTWKPIELDDEQRTLTINEFFEHS